MRNFSHAIFSPFFLAPKKKKKHIFLLKQALPLLDCFLCPPTLALTSPSHPGAASSRNAKSESSGTEALWLSAIFGKKGGSLPIVTGSPEFPPRASLGL